MKGKSLGGSLVVLDVEVVHTTAIHPQQASLPVGPGSERDKKEESPVACLSRRMPVLARDKEGRLFVSFCEKPHR